jgi:purine-nucleoside phosphorylase
VFITNAAGGLNPLYNVGDIVCIMDHLCIPMMAGHNPLMGPNDAELGPRFPPMSNAYDDNLQSLVMDSARRLKMEYKVRPNGVYCFVSGPMYESKAECRYLRSVGGDAVGMSTIPEIAAAHHAGMKVLCLSVITNKVVITDGQEAANHEEVLAAVNQCSQQIQTLITDIIVNSNSYLQSLPDLPTILPNVEDEVSGTNSSACTSPSSSDRKKHFGIPFHCLFMSTCMLTIGASMAVIMLRKR